MSKPSKKSNTSSEIVLSQKEFLKLQPFINPNVEQKGKLNIVYSLK